MEQERESRNKPLIILGVTILIALGMLLYSFNSQIKYATKSVEVPVAKETIHSGVQITKEMITIIEVPFIGVPNNIYLSVNQLIGQYTNADFSVPEGSMFYEEAIDADGEG